MQSWAFGRFEGELGPALVEYLSGIGVGSADRPATDDDLALALSWLLIDRRLACGDTPARLYARLPELPAEERRLAERIASSRLGVHRVVDVDRGAWMELEDVLTGTRVRVDSPNVSVIAVRWHVLICRVELGGPVPALWGGAAFYEPGEEAEIVAELQRMANSAGLSTDAAGLADALNAGAREMACFIPPSRRAKRTLYTLEGDPVAPAEATWRLRDPAAALGALGDAPELVWRAEDADGDAVFDWPARRRDLLVRRPPLPPGAFIIEGGMVTLDEHGEVHDSDLTSLGTFTVSGDVLEVSCLSEPRLDGAIALVERNLGPLATELQRRIGSIDPAQEDRDRGPAPRRTRSASRPGGAEPADGLDAGMQAVVYRRWIDDPNPHLGGLSPRQAAGRPEHREQLERQLRTLEYHDARGRNHPLPGPEAARLRRELALDCEPAAR